MNSIQISASCFLCKQRLTFSLRQLMSLCARHCLCEMVSGQHSCLLDGLMLSSFSSSDICTAAPSKAPHMCTHTRTISLSQAPWGGLQWWWKQKCNTDRCWDKESQIDTQKDPSKDSKCLHDPSASRVVSAMKYKTFIFHQWQVNLHFICSPDPQALKSQKGDKKTFEAHIIRRKGKKPKHSS